MSQRTGGDSLMRGLYLFNGNEQEQCDGPFSPVWALLAGTTWHSWQHGPLPLARAPLDHCCRVRAGVGVTPARAGCAETCGAVRSALSDHSCSRRLHGAGVASSLNLRDHYSPAPAVPPTLNTKDQRTELLPLARALRPRAPGRPAGRRVSPAHAVTLRTGPLPDKGSRGVTSACAGPRRSTGSSGSSATSHPRSREAYSPAA